MDTQNPTVSHVYLSWNSYFFLSMKFELTTAKKCLVSGTLICPCKINWLWEMVYLEHSSTGSFRFFPLYEKKVYNGLSLILIWLQFSFYLHLKPKRRTARNRFYLSTRPRKAFASHKSITPEIFLRLSANTNCIPKSQRHPLLCQKVWCIIVKKEPTFPPVALENNDLLLYKTDQII